jgi:hypothetical protein
LKEAPELGIVQTMLKEIQSHSAFRGKPRYIPSIHGEIIGGCDTLCILSGEAFVVFINPVYIKQLIYEDGQPGIEVGSPQYRVLRQIVGHELSHAIHSYNYIVNEKKQGRWALPSELKGEISYWREHLTVDAIAALLLGITHEESASTLDQINSRVHMIIGNNIETDLPARSYCLKNLPKKETSQ